MSAFLSRTLLPLWRRIDAFHSRRPMFVAIAWAGSKGALASVLADVVLHELAKRAAAKAEATASEETQRRGGEGTETLEVKSSEHFRPELQMGSAAVVPSTEDRPPAPTNTKDQTHDVHPGAPPTSQNIPPLQIDSSKAAAFGIWNGVFCGGFLKWLYADVFGHFFPLVDPKTGNRHPLFRRHVLSMVCFCNFVSTPLFVTPNYYLIKAALEAMASPGFVERVSVSSQALGRECVFVVKRAATRYRNEWLAVHYVTWSCWIPIHLVTFTVIPVHLRQRW